MEQVLAANPPKPRSINPAIPRDLETIVLKAIARDPALRYQSASELAEDLRLYLEDRPIRARRASSAEQAFRWCRRNPAVASLMLAVLLVVSNGLFRKIVVQFGFDKTTNQSFTKLRYLATESIPANQLSSFMNEFGAGAGKPAFLLNTGFSTYTEWQKKLQNKK